MNSLINRLHLKKVGLLEILFAMYPILMGYQYGSVPCSLLFLIIMDALALAKKKRIRNNKTMLFLTVFVLLHEFVLFFTLPSVPSSFVNLVIGFAITLLSIPIITSAIDYDKIVGSINWVTIICIIGLVFQFMELQISGSVTALKVPFMPALDQESRLFEESFRPSSFFWEPQSYCSFMFVPLFIALLDKNYIWSVVIIISMFLSGSTTGIIMSGVILILFVFTQEAGFKSKVMMIIAGVGLGVLLFTSSLFTKGVEKMENVNYEENSRLYNGPALVINMPIEDLILGGNAADVSDYYASGAAGSGYLLEKYDKVYVSTFWEVIVKFGIIGLVLYMAVYIYPIRKNKATLLYMGPLIVALFSNPDFIGGLFAFEFIFIYAFLKKNPSSKANNVIYVE